MNTDLVNTAAHVAATSGGDMMNMAKAIVLGIGVLGPALGVAMVFSKAFESMARNPEVAGRITTFMFIGAGMVEFFGIMAIVAFFMIK
jgi:F-type H+-transporting ATPase subunit c